MEVTLISPNIVTQKGDFFGTGIPYLPVPLAYTASYLREKGCSIGVIDAFGELPFQKRCKGEFILQGLTPKQIISKINPQSSLICIYAGHVVEHGAIVDIIMAIKNQLNIPIAIIENCQAVTSYSLLKVKEEFFNIGVDFIIYGDPELTISELIDELENKNYRFSRIDGLIYHDNKEIVVNKNREPITDLDSIPFPAWDLFPVKNYWKLGYAHAPYKKSYLPLLSSRGCPYNCNFCIIPFTNKRKWHARSARNVFEEIKHFARIYGVREFHFEDLNPTVDRKRIEELCKLIIGSELKLNLKFASGTKIETMDENTIRLLKKAGCDYISFSPESGSKQVLKLMNKEFDHAHCLRMLRLMKKLKITTQACFILGYPGERKEDIIKTKRYLYRLFREGLDETAILVMIAAPGSKSYEASHLSGKDLSKFTFSPKWRKNYKFLNRTRTQMYLTSLIIRLLFHPRRFFDIYFNAILGNFKNKIEMNLYRLIKVRFLLRKCKDFNK